MGAYSELDAALREDGDAFVEDDADESGGCPAFETDDTDNIPASPGDDSPKGESEPAPLPNQTEGQSQAEPEPGKDTAKAASDEDARKAHEEAEAKRKAEWEARQQQKKEAEQQQLAALDAMSDEELLAASLKRVGDDTEKLTRRHMMECVMEHIQTMCLGDPAFARKVMQPRKNMIRCSQYIGRKAWEYVQDELKAKGVTPSRETPYASAIPEGVCYQWAEDYFNDPDAKEDHEEEEKFVPQPYRGTSSTRAKKSKGKGKTAAKADTAKNTASKNPKPAEAKKQEDSGQISFGGFVMPEGKAG